MPEAKEIELRSEEIQEILTRVPHWMIRWGNLVILVVLLLLFLMSWIVKYPDIVTTEITITTQAPPEKLIARTSGRIEKILVANKEVVEENTVLAIIENTADYKDVFKLKSIIDKINLADKQFIFPFETLMTLNLGEIESSFVVFEKDYVAYELNKKLQPYQAEGIAQNVEGIELKERLSLLIQQKEINERELDFKKKELERYKKLYDKGIIATQEWESKNLDYLQVEKNFRSINASISEIKSSVNDLSRNKKTTKINENKDDISLYRNAIQSFNQLKKAIADWELAYVLRSSVAGEVSFLQIWTENQTIASGENVFTIIPKNQDNYIGKVKAKALNSGKIKEDQDVNIRLSNYPDREFGVIRGKVKSISMVPDKDGNLLIDVSLPEKLETSYHKKIIFQQEMTGTADIVTEDLRLIERMLYQFRDVFRR
ncbi:HlyD family efflux transporter periplasmic adaptor subunit [uncultured Flavobacterium sp.]|uniref:HlyD family secretion protein n=1 Tax=uncultured Flavobacterium sp. TaxID=165435 RepID=UPI0025D458B2|nr:HlyD family efflux transporter periplasmic adaptor subunit [uncultured Flavobacterium sp.]